MMKLTKLFAESVNDLSNFILNATLTETDRVPLPSISRTNFMAARRYAHLASH